MKNQVDDANDQEILVWRVDCFKLAATAGTESWLG